MAAGDLTPARRVASMDDLERAGDYTLGAIIEDDVTKPMVWFLLPLHEGETLYDRPTRGSGLHGVTEPPWTFRECPDGSLEIRASIASHDAEGMYWHGYLNEGNVWREV
jgi:hypothetical protein